jgi:hypothetical protein
MNAVEREIQQLIQEHGGVLSRTKKHNVYTFPGGKTFTMAQTPSDVRAAANQLSQLRHILGLVDSSAKNTGDINVQRQVKAEQRGAAQRDAQKRFAAERSLQSYRDMVLPEAPKPAPYVDMREVPRLWTGTAPVPIRRDRFRKAYQPLQHGSARSYPQHVIDQVNWMRKMGAPEQDIQQYMANSQKENEVMPTPNPNYGGMSVSNIDAYIAQLKTGINYMQDQLRLAEQMRSGMQSLRPFLSGTGASSSSITPHKVAVKSNGPTRTRTNYPYSLNERMAEVLSEANRPLDWDEIREAIKSKAGFEGARDTAIKQSVYNPRSKGWFSSPERGKFTISDEGRQFLAQRNSQAQPATA